MLRPSPNHGTQRLPNDDDDEVAKSSFSQLPYVFCGYTSLLYFTLLYSTGSSYLTMFAFKRLISI